MSGALKIAFLAALFAGTFVLGFSAIWFGLSWIELNLLKVLTREQVRMVWAGCLVLAVFVQLWRMEARLRRIQEHVEAMRWRR